MVTLLGAEGREVTACDKTPTFAEERRYLPLPKFVHP